jgi:ABC-type transport system involved in cytochrome c biogenesis permease subunit
MERHISLISSLELRSLNFAVIAYGVAALAYLAGLFIRPRGFRITGTIVLFAGWLLATFALAFRTIQALRLPLQTRYDIMFWFVWWLLVVYLIAEERTKVTLPGLLIAGAAFGIGTWLLRMDNAIAPVLPQQGGIWFLSHRATLYCAYGLLGAGVAIELSSPFYSLLTRHERREPAERQERYLEFRSYAYRLILFAFPLLSYSLISNALWRSSIRGHYWAWAQEETWALIAWLLYAGYLHLRTQLRTSRAVATVVSILGAAAMILTFTGVKWLVK